MGSYEYEILCVLNDILETLQQMKQQEFEYWEAWKVAKNRECST